MWGLRDGSVVTKSTGCSSRGPEFDSQHPHGASQPSVTLVPGDPVPFPFSPGLRHLRGAQMYMHKKATVYIKIILKENIQCISYFVNS